jgi:hypothetical protein
VADPSTAAVRRSASCGRWSTPRPRRRSWATGTSPAVNSGSRAGWKARATAPICTPTSTSMRTDATPDSIASWCPEPTRSTGRRRCTTTSSPTSMTAAVSPTWAETGSSKRVSTTLGPAG